MPGSYFGVRVHPTRVSDTTGGGDVVEEVFYPTERVALVDWHRVSGAKPAVALVGVVALLAFVAGLSNLSDEALALEGPLAAVLPGATGFARFGGVVAAFALALVTVGLRRRKRLALRAALVGLPVVALLTLTTLRPTDVPLLLAALVAYPLLLRNRAGFDQPLRLEPLQVASLSSFLAVGVYGTVGSYSLRSQFAELDGWADAVYYVIVTVATVGYGDVTPTTPVAQWFSLSVIMLGTGAFTIAVGALVGPAIESRMAAAFGTMTPSEFTLLEDHVVILGHGDVTVPLLETLEDETDVVVVTRDSDAAAALGDDVNVLTGDPADESVLDDARIGVARGVVAAANEGKHVDKLGSVGADRVVDLRTIGGRLLGQSVLGDEPASGEDLFEKP